MINIINLIHYFLHSRNLLTISEFFFSLDPLTIKISIHLTINKILFLNKRYLLMICIYNNRFINSCTNLRKNLSSCNTDIFFFYKRYRIIFIIKL